MIENNLQKALIPYHARKGWRIVFRNKYTLNELALEMWDTLGYKGIDSSALSRIINGKRLFNPKQLDAFCKALDITGKAKAKIIEALEADYLNRYGLSSSSSSSMFYNTIYFLTQQYDTAKETGDKGIFILLGIYIILISWWFILLITDAKNTTFNIGYGIIYAIIPFLAGIMGLLKTQRLYSFKSSSAKSGLFFSSGLLTWSMGSIIWGFYNVFLHTAIPYPSWADISYMLSPLLWFLGLVHLYSDKKEKTRSTMKFKEIIAVIIFLTITAILYYLFIVLERKGSINSTGEVIKIFFDFYYPLSDVVLILLIFFIFHSSQKDPAKHRALIYLICGFILMFFADLSFSYASTIGSFYMGHWIDLIFTTSLFILSIGVNSISLDN